MRTDVTNATNETGHAPSNPSQAMLRIAEDYERWFVPPIGTPSARRVVDAARIDAGDRVLDLACGTGVAARLAAEHAGPTGSVVGVDANPAMVEVADRAAPELEWHTGVAEDLPFDEASFDVVVCSLGFQFFADKPAALSEIARVLASDGRVALGTPGPTPPLMVAIDGALADHVGPEASGFVHAVFSVHDREQVTGLLGAAGFVDVETDARPLPLRVPPPAEFFWQYVHSTPLAMLAAGLDDDARAALERDVVERCRPFVDGDGAVMEPNLLVATARRRREAGQP
ncbi:MAG: methyltransferase domain-containing protein [Acidimicrobiia bacterium]|nr:methyltransferase domain-containing protein [Acidimicrobiia bacterium]